MRRRSGHARGARRSGQSWRGVYPCRCRSRRSSGVELYWSPFRIERARKRRSYLAQLRERALSGDEGPRQGANKSGGAFEVHRAGRFVESARGFEGDRAREQLLAGGRERRGNGRVAACGGCEYGGPQRATLRADPPELIFLAGWRLRQTGDLQHGVIARGRNCDEAGRIGSGRQRSQADNARVGSEHGLGELPADGNLTMQGREVAIAVFQIAGEGARLTAA